MDRNELTAAIAGALAAAFLLGWVTRWIFARMNAGQRDMPRTVGLAADLHAAEDARHRAEDRRAAAERRAAEAEAELAQTRERLTTVENQLDEIRAAYDAAMTPRA